MKVYLDDIREAPRGWHRAYTYQDCIDVLSKNNVTEISLDHDLGLNSRGTGYDVLLWIEKQVVYNPSYQLPRIQIHTQNPVGAARMAQAISQIEKMWCSKARLD